MSAGDRISVCVAGAGLAGSLLAWRLASERSIARVDLLVGAAFRGLRDATATSGGVIRAYDPDPRVRELAADSLLELYGDRRLRRWGAYDEVGSLYVHDGGAPVPELAELDRHRAGTAALLSARELHDRDWAGLPPAATAVYEPHAGRISPGALRAELLREVSHSRSAEVLAASVGTVNVTGSGSVRCELIGAPSRDYDVVVLATGRWSSDVLRASRLEEGELRTKVIECGLWETGDWRPPPFVDGISGLYGTPLDANVMLLGLPTDRWDVDPDWPPDSSESPLQVMTSALRRFPRLRLGPIRRWVTSADSYGRAGTLALDPVIGTEGTVFTFAGGSGGSIKTALAASHRAAAQIAGPWSELDTVPASPRTPEGIRT